MLSPEQQSEILALHFGKKKGKRAIARELNIDRKSVAAVIARREVLFGPVIRKPRSSILDDFKPAIADMLKAAPTISAAAILQRLREVGYLGGYSILKEWVTNERPVRRGSREAFLQIEFQAGETAQVDWGEFGDVFGDGVKVHCFVMVLCYSRLLYLEFTRSERFEEFIRCHENAFHFFSDRVPQECWYDNLTTAVQDRVGSLVRFNSRFFAYMGHHGIRPHACNPARGNEKGRVEDGVKFIRSSFWPGRRLQDFADLSVQAGRWRDEFANRREHRATRKVPALCFAAEEKDRLRPMNPEPYDTDEIFTAVVAPNSLLVYETNRYSIPWTMVGMTVTVRINERRVAMFYHDRPVAAHERSYLKHQTFTKPAHLQGLLERKGGDGSREGWQMAAVKSIGPAMRDYLETLRAGNRSIRKELSRILALATVYGEVEVYAACEQLLQAGIVGVDNLELSLKNKNELAPKPLVFENTRLNRVVPSVDLRRYDALFFQNLSSTPESQSHEQND